MAMTTTPRPPQAEACLELVWGVVMGGAAFAE